MTKAYSHNFGEIIIYGKLLELKSDFFCDFKLKNHETYVWKIKKSLNLLSCH